MSAPDVTPPSPHPIPTVSPMAASSAPPDGAADGGSVTTRSLPASTRSHGSPDENGAGAINLANAQSRLLVEKMLVALAQDAAQSEDKPTSRFGFADYGMVVRRRWIPMLAMFLVTVPVFLWRLKPGAPVYNATATMLLPSASSRMDASSDPLKTGVSADDLGANIATKIAIVTSQPLVQDAMSQLDAETRARGWGSSQAVSAPVSASAPVSPDLVNITVTAADPIAAKALANKLIEVYAQHTRTLARSSYEDSMELLSVQKSQAEKLLLQAKRELQGYRERTGILSIDARLAAVAESVATLEKDALDAQLEAAAGAASQTVQADGVVNSLREKAATARAHYDDVLHDLLPTSPEATRARQEWQEAQRMLDQRIAVLQHAAQERSTTLQTRLAEARRTATSLPSTEFKLSQIASKVKLLEITYETLSDRYTAMSIARYNKVDVATTLAPATSVVPVGRTWMHAIVLTILCALIFAALVAALMEQLDNTVHSSDQLEPILGAPVLGTLPLLDASNGQALLKLSSSQPPGATPALEAGASDRPRSGSISGSASGTNKSHKPRAGRPYASNMLLEACRIVRTNLAFAGVDTPLRSLLVTSADSGEGKSFCALNLAKVIAYDGKKVILLDCDLRRPTQHRLNSLPLKPGFTNTVLEPQTFEEALHPTEVENLWIMTAGAIPPNPPELLGSVQSRRLIEELKSRCDLVVIDSPPILNLTDAQVLSSIVDGVLLVIGADSTSIPHIQRAVSNIRHAGGRLLGSIFNKIQAHNDPYGYYGYYKYGSYNYYSYESAHEEDAAANEPSGKNGSQSH